MYRYFTLSDPEQLNSLYCIVGTISGYNGTLLYILLYSICACLPAVLAKATHGNFKRYRLQLVSWIFRPLQAQTRKNTAISWRIVRTISPSVPSGLSTGRLGTITNIVF